MGLEVVNHSGWSNTSNLPAQHTNRMLSKITLTGLAPGGLLGACPKTLINKGFKYLQARIYAKILILFQ
jgi:hypothetical protein